MNFILAEIEASNVEGFHNKMSNSIKHDYVILIAAIWLAILLSSVIVFFLLNGFSVQWIFNNGKINVESKRMLKTAIEPISSGRDVDTKIHLKSDKMPFLMFNSNGLFSLSTAIQTHVFKKPKLKSIPHELQRLRK